MLDADFLNCRLPEGQSFTTIVKHKQIYVDKTDLIYKLALDRKPILLTRPRRFGKSTIVSTLEELFTHGVKPFVDADGNLKESYFKGLAIEKLWKDEGEYKVIHIDFSTFDTDTTAYICDVRPDLRKNDKAEVYAQFFNYNFCNFIKDIAFKFGVELSSNKITPTKLFEDLIKKLGENKVVFLVDEYDFPLTHIPSDLAASEHEDYLSKISMILKSFYSLIKSNSKYFRKIFVTGITRFKDVSMLTLGNTISDISLSIDFGTIVGFTRAELKKYFYDHLVMAVTLLQNKSEEKVTNSDIETLLDQLASWYDGYSFDENAQSHVFSTISVLNFFCNSNARTKFKNYWYELGGTPTILVNNCQKILDSDIDNAFKEDAEFWVSEDAFKNPSSYENMDPKVMLYQTGYLTLAKAIDTDVYLKFPNLEIRSSFAKLQYLYLFKNAEKLINSSFNQELSKLNFETPLEKIVEYFSTILNVLDYQKNAFTHECHVVNPIFCYLYAKKFNVMQEKHSLVCRADLVIDFDNKSTLVFEFKFRKTGSAKTAEDLLNEALQQIKEKQYTQIPDRKVKGYALVFDQETKKFVAFKQS